MQEYTYDIGGVAVTAQFASDDIAAKAGARPLNKAAQTVNKAVAPAPVPAPAAPTQTEVPNGEPAPASI